ncbi:DNA polymerase III subunit delta [Buchnera aphidicola (Eriosoma grossulariae)]|uniref:DNA polymerase III subunit delta n=1 Tax=Buchnera aphidicola TaxID=9 RepID=UPI003463B311
MTIFYDNLDINLQKKLYSCYILQGKEIILCQDSEELIIHYANKNGYYKIKYFYPNNKLEWEKIFSMNINKNIFVEKKILIINISLHEMKNNNYKTINTLIHTSNNYTLLIIKCYQDFYFNTKKIFYTNPYNNGLLVNCTILNHISFKKWFDNKIKKNKIIINKNIQKILCSYYENNLLSLSKILDVLSLIYFNSEVQITEIYNIISDECLFNVFQWSTSILSGNGKKSVKILKKLIDSHYEPIILIRVLQKSILKIIQTQYLMTNMLSNIKKTNTIKLFDKNNFLKLYKIIKLLSKIEINIKTHKKNSIWIQLKILSLTFN